MELLFWMIVAHFVADYGLQSGWVAAHKGKHAVVLIAHSMIWTGAVMLPVVLFKEFELIHVAFLFGGHAAVDYGKSLLLDGLGYYEKKDDKDEAMIKTAWRLVTVDQLFHAFQILLVWWLV